MTTEPRRSARIANLKKKNDMSESKNSDTSSMRNVIDTIVDMVHEHLNATSEHDTFYTTLQIFTTITEQSELLARYPPIRSVLQKRMLYFISTINDIAFLSNKDKLRFLYVMGNFQKVIEELPYHPRYVAYPTL
jgi:hypothetical protein